MTCFRILVAALMVAGLAGTASGEPTPSQTVENCLAEGKGWKACFAGQGNERRACILAGGGIDYCFPEAVALRESSDDERKLPRPSILLPRSLWTTSPYDVLTGRPIP